MHVDNAANGLSCDCECLKCEEKLEAIQGEIRTKHFRHYTNKECEGSQETALHELGKQILVNSSQINIPRLGSITYTDAEAEKRQENIRPDVSAKHGGQSIYFEIFVSHLVDQKKDLFIKENRLRCIEIDLSTERASTFEEIKHKVLETIENKRIVFWDPEPVARTTGNNTGCLLQLLLLLTVLFGLAWLTKEG